MNVHLRSTMNAAAPLDGEHFDVLVIGGGINGVAIARECARAGRRTLLVEQHDFAAGTTSRSTRIIHGGLRYLEHGDFGQVRESLNERHRLLQDYPHLVRPLEFLLALDQDSQRSALAIRAGLWLYRQMGGRLQLNGNGHSRAQLERLLDAGRQFSLFSFHDAQCEFPERLVAEWLVEAIQAGCVARNHTQVLTVKIQDGRAQGALLRNRLNREEEQIGANVIINATGPWADGICQRSGIQTPTPMVGGVRGSHLVLPKFAGAPGAAVYTEAIDGRPIFVVPWNEQILMGTTEVRDENDPAQARPSEEEIGYLIDSLRRLFPAAPIGRSDVRCAFAGVRPLPYSPPSEPCSISRRHYFHDHASDGAAGMISVIGGKLTTAGRLAQDCVTALGVSQESTTTLQMVREAEIDVLLNRCTTAVAEAGGTTRETARGTVEWFGKRAMAIARRASKSEQMKASLCPHTTHIVAEVLEAFENECAATLADALLRRVPVALGACWSTQCSHHAATAVGAAAGWDERRTAAQLETFETERAAFLQRLT
jgi:glycerol-3-phosphate dehydrogenase